MSEASQDTTGEQLSTVVSDIDDDSKQLIREKARCLPVDDDDRVIDNTDDMVDLSDAAMSSMLFDAVVADVHGLSDSTIVTVEFQKEVEFPKGDGWVSFSVRFEKPTETVETMTVEASLY
ncbi:hypothetical protein [Haloplanus halobius]|uniref:hypothetical protein n=1 Tax=Haloplanus halobius TaxID=2934938 RepID=UPI00200C00AE|nr:hypothetical protein [Haloplanus sp. XH21]